MSPTLADLEITLVGDNQVSYKEIRPRISSDLAKPLELDSELAQARNLLAEGGWSNICGLDDPEALVVFFHCQPHFSTPSARLPGRLILYDFE